jgi:hypothetical protein
VPYLFSLDDIDDFADNLGEILAGNTEVVFKQVSKAHECVVPAGKGLCIHGLRDQDGKSFNVVSDIVLLGDVANEAVGEVPDFLLL